MASGDSLLILVPNASTPPGTLYATLDVMVGGSTPAESVPILDFDDTTVEYADWPIMMPAHYAGTTGITCTIIWSAAETAADVVAWEAALRRVADDAEAITSSHTYVYNSSGDVTAPSALGEVAYNDITFTDGADMDSVVASDYFIFRIKRVAPGGTDVTGDASIHAIHITET